MSLLPAVTTISDVYPHPDNLTARAGFSSLWTSINEFFEKPEVTIASGGTTDIGAALTTKLEITGATTITSFGTTYRGPIVIRFLGSPLLTHNATTLRLPGAINYTPDAGETIIVSPISTAGVWSGWQVGIFAKAVPYSTTKFEFQGVGVGTPPSANTGEIRATHNVTAYYSDKRLKKVLRNIGNALNAVLSLNGVVYVGSKKAHKYGYTSEAEQVGLISQEVQKVLPQVVCRAPFDIAQAPDGTEYSKSGGNFMTIQYEKVVPLLVEAIKEQQGQIVELQNQIRALNDI